MTEEEQQRETRKKFTEFLEKLVGHARAFGEHLPKAEENKDVRRKLAQTMWGSHHTIRRLSPMT